LPSLSPSHRPPTHLSPSPLPPSPFTFLGRSNNKYIYGETLSTNGACAAFREYTVDVGVAAEALTFADDACGSLRLEDAGLVTRAAFTGEGLFVYLGADDDSGVATWGSVSVWGDSLGWDPSGTRAPTARPSHAPTHRPVLPPTPLPTVPLGEPALADDFSGFDGDLWLAKCAGCSYTGGTNSALYVSGDSQLMRTVGTFSGLTHLRGRLVKTNTCNDHVVVVSTSGSYTWLWGSNAGVVKFGWNCGSKVIYSQATSTTTDCHYMREYTMDVEITETLLVFNDDFCGSLHLEDTIGATGGLYVYLVRDRAPTTSACLRPPWRLFPPPPPHTLEVTPRHHHYHHHHHHHHALHAPPPPPRPFPPAGRGRRLGHGGVEGPVGVGRAGLGRRRRASFSRAIPRAVAPSDYGGHAHLGADAAHLRRELRGCGGGDRG